MSGNQSYIEQSIAALKTIDAERLSAARLTMPSNIGSETEFYSLGWPRAYRRIHVGLKVPRPDRQVEVARRFRDELSMISLLADRLPDLRAKLPRFMGSLLVAGETKALITEDVSKVLVKPIRQVRVSEATRNLLRLEFCSEYQPLENVFDEDLLNRRVAFMVGGSEMLLDFSPVPILEEQRAGSGLYVHLVEAMSRASELSIEVPEGSNLGQALA